MLPAIIARFLGWCGIAMLSLVAVDVGAQDSVSYPPLSEVIRIGPPQLVIGEEQRESPALFGIIRGVAVDGQGDIYVLDASDHSVRRFGPTGQYIAKAGRSGHGPGDLAHPYSLWHDGAHTLYVVDDLNGINVFDTRNGGMVYRTRFAEERWPRSVCEVGGQFVVAGFHRGHILHVMDAARRIVKSFGDPFRADTSELVRAIANSGAVVLTCDEVSQRMYVSQGSHGRVRAYDGSGTLLWETELPGFRGSRVFREPTGAVTTVFPRHLTESIRPVGTEYVVVQAHHKERRPQSRRGGAIRRTIQEDRGVLTYVLSARDGRVITRQYAGPFLMAGAGGNAVGYDDEPYPRVYSLRVSEVAGR